jgi:hypothetical protein
MARLDRSGCVLAALLWPCFMAAQTPAEIASILQRLDRLEQENRALAAEVKTLRAKLDGGSDALPAADTPLDTVAAAPVASLDERVRIQEKRTEELADTKVEASQKFPIRLTGMALFNAFLNSKQNGGSDYPILAAPTGTGRAGATLRQTIVGLEFRGPQTVWGGRVHGSAYMDFFAGANNSTMRLRTASMQIDWKTRSVMAGLEKPIFNPREPSSLALVGISPLTGTGTLWLWLPQVRVEQDWRFTANTGIRAQMGVIQTREVGPYAGEVITGRLEPARPGLEGRYEFFHNFDEERRFEIAPGFHTSRTHVAGFSIPSQIFSLDWFFNPHRKVEFTGAFYAGENVAPLGNGTLQGYTISYGRARAVDSIGGWGQITVHAAPRVDLHLFNGQQDDRNAMLGAGRIGKNFLYGGNLYYRLAPNVILGLETTQVRTMYIGQGLRINNHYDLALAYHF